MNTISAWTTRVVPLALSFCLLTFPLTRAPAQPLEIGVLGGVSVYNGDFSPVRNVDYFQILRPAGSIFLRYAPADWLGIRLGLLVTTLGGNSDLNTTTVYRNRSVALRTPLRDLALTVELSPFNIRLLGLDVRPYLYTGGALYHFEPQLRIDGQWVKMQPFGTEGQGLPGNPPRYKTQGFAFTAGGGIRVAISDRIVLGAELGGRIPYTDYLDDVSGLAVNYPRLLRERGAEVATLSNPAATENTGDYRRGNRAADFYYHGGVSIHYRFGVGGGRPMGCPSF